jgi:hypothetical protein
MAAVYSPTFSGVALVNVRTWKPVRVIEPFSDPAVEQAGGFYDGNYAVWKVYHSQETLDDFTVWDWHSGGQPTVVGEAVETSPGAFAVSPWYDPTLWSHYAAWVEGLDSLGRGRLVLLDLASGKRTIVRVGHPGSVAFYQGLLVWAESPSPGAETEPQAYNIVHRSETRPPSALSRARGGSSYVADGSQLAYVGADGRSLWLTTDPSRPAQRLLRLHVGGFNPPLVMTGSLLLAAMSEGSIVANGDSSAYFVLPKTYTLTASKSYVMIAPGNTTKEAHPTMPWAVLTEKSLTALAC